VASRCAVALRAHPATAEIKVVMLTARSDTHDRDEGFAAGADEYITKPFSPVHLLDKVLEVLGPGALIAPR
jgi:two-component system, OmpR family, phosphate regulon response regulator PhoB